ncbi:MAG: UTRA domain-containing protein, partial [Enterococcus sp.]|nr:UTRA domain-containing protein [Enterococcus sp.]
IYDYIEQQLDFKIAASKTVLKTETATTNDFELLDLGNNNCVGELENVVYTDKGKLFEHTKIRYIPNEYALVAFEQRKC